jgi:hypothetical protein
VGCIRAVFGNDPYIKDLQTVLEASPYMHKNASIAIMLDLVEPLFHVVPFIDRVEGDTYVLKSLVKLKDPALCDFNYEIVDSMTAYNKAVNDMGAGNWLEFSHAIQTESKTTDKNVELFYYPKEIIDVIEDY